MNTFTVNGTPNNYYSLEVTNTGGSQVCFYISTISILPYPNGPGGNFNDHFKKTKKLDYFSVLENLFFHKNWPDYLELKWLLKLTSDGKNSGVAQCAALGLKLGAVKNNVEKNAITSLMSN